MDITFDDTFKAEVVEAEGKKKVVLSGTLLHDSMNKNFWSVKSEDLDAIAKSVGKTQPIDIQHSMSDWEIVGSFISGHKSGKVVSYVGEITDTKAVNKFETDTWTADNMGISPTMEFGGLTCSICGKDPRKGECNHYRGETYDGKIAYVILVKPKLVRAGLTSRPAYAPGAGTISTVALNAELEKLLKKEVKSMTDDTLKEQIAQKDVKIKELQASVDGFEIKAKEIETAEIKKLKTDYDAVKAEIAKRDEKLKTLAAEKKAVEENLEAADKQIAKVKAEKRLVELTELLGDKEVAQTIVDKDLTDDEFKAEVELIQKVKASVKTTGSNGSLPPENGTQGSSDIVKAEFGMDTNEILKNIGIKIKE